MPIESDLAKLAMNWADPARAGHGRGLRGRVGLHGREARPRTRERRWEMLDDDLEYGASELDRSIVARDQIRTVIRTFREKLHTEIFPGRTEVPKTLVFAKSDAHAEDIVEIIREEFGRGNDFCRKITYKSTGKKPEELIRDFRNDYMPRIAVTVDMVATGTDIKPLEVVLFMRDVKSRVLFEIFETLLPGATTLRDYLWVAEEDAEQLAREAMAVMSREVVLNMVEWAIGDFWNRQPGWPDLLIISRDDYRFSEVKSPNDRLSLEQMRWFEWALTESSPAIPCEICRVIKGS